MLQLRNRVVLLQDQLGQSAGLDPLEDRKLVGYILACQDILNTDLEE